MLLLHLDFEYSGNVFCKLSGLVNGHVVHEWTPGNSRVNFENAFIRLQINRDDAMFAFLSAGKLGCLGL